MSAIWGPGKLRHGTHPQAADSAKGPDTGLPGWIKTFTSRWYYAGLNACKLTNSHYMNSGTGSEVSFWDIINELK